MSIGSDATIQFTERPGVPPEYVDTADLMEAVTGTRPAYEFDVTAGRWRWISLPVTGLWPQGFAHAYGLQDNCGEITMFLRIEDQVGSEPPIISMYLYMDGGGDVRVRLDREDARLWAKLLKQAAGWAESQSAQR